MLDVLVIAVVFALVFRSNRKIAESFGFVHGPWYKQSLDRLLLYHTLFSFLFPLVPGDALGYWNFNFQQLAISSDKMSDYFGVGTVFLLWLDFIPARVMGLSFLTGNILYGVCGFLGLRYLFLLYVGALKTNFRIVGLAVIPYLFYLPNMNFWTAGVGKDTLSFFGIAWFLYSLVHFRKKFIYLLPSFMLVYAIRPHVGLMLLLGTTVAMIFSREMKPVYKGLFLVLAVAGFMYVYQKVAIFLMVQDLSVDSLSGLAKDKAGALSARNVGSAVDITQYSIPMRLFTYLYRPLLFDVHNLITFLSFLENLIYLLVTWIGIRAIRWRDLSAMPLWLKAGFVTFLAAMIVFSNSLGNLGIIMREKNMTMIYLPMVCLWISSRRRVEAATGKILTAT
ncbi:MAG TPA: hypothetical protein VL547_02890 [Dinghuibacter sp.]|uniref:hypothetical protein n=1 Tax=Dinghuibacter sp. TaxID=2024697 RepID=UPI002BA8D8EE|nr:hypothetical protein [Dinghuibacter sp.]HTJ10941.1 hypothetical protein [Dinghuibacter sp.]